MTTFPQTYHEKVTELLLSQPEALTKVKDPEKIITSTLELLSHFLKLNNGRVFLWDSQSSHLTIRYSHGLSLQQINAGKYEISEGVTGKAFGSRHAFVIKNTDYEPLFKGKVSFTKDSAKLHNSYIAVPITADGYDLGILAVDCNNTLDGDIEAYALILEKVASMLGKIIHHYELDEFNSSYVA